MKLVATGRKLKTVCEMITLVTSNESIVTRSERLITLEIVPRASTPLHDGPVPATIEDVVGDQQREKGRADNFVRGVAQPVVSVGGQQQADRQKIERKPKEKEPAHGR